MSIVHRCGYTEVNSTDVLLSYNDIIHLHEVTWDNWEHPRGYYKGPQLERILEKGLGSFPRLQKLEVAAMVEFYDNFHKTALIYLLPVVPFDCVSIKMGFEALCPPGLGLPRYTVIARVLMELLPRLLPRTDTQVSSIVNMVRMEPGNGYDLLWRILALAVPGFDPTIQVKIPVWVEEDIFEFALSFLLYFRLQAKKGVVQDDRTQSISFLNAVNEPAYAGAITTLYTCVTNYTLGLEDGYLPANLCIMGLAMQLHANARTRAQSILPRVCRTLGGITDYSNIRVTIQDSPMVARLKIEGMAVSAITIAPIGVAVARTCRGDAVTVVVVALLLLGAVLYARTGIMVNIVRTSSVMLAVRKGTWRRIAMSWPSHSSSKNINVNCQWMPKIRLKQDGLNGGVPQSETPQRNLVG